jgi:hypothetical protein
MVGNSIKNWDEVLALGKLYRDSKEFEIKQEYFLRLLDYFIFSRDRSKGDGFKGMRLEEIETIFGKSHAEPLEGETETTSTRFGWAGSRDSVLVWFKDGIATGGAYIQGF